MPHAPGFENHWSSAHVVDHDFFCTAVRVVQHRCVHCLVNCELYSMQYSQIMCFHKSKQLLTFEMVEQTAYTYTETLQLQSHDIVHSV